MHIKYIYIYVFKDASEYLFMIILVWVPMPYNSEGTKKETHVPGL